MTEEAQVPGGAGRALVLTCAPGHRGLHFGQPFQYGHRALRKDSVKVRIWQRRLYFNISVGKWRYSLCNNSVRESGGSVYVVSGIEWEDGQEFNSQHRKYSLMSINEWQIVRWLQKNSRIEKQTSPTSRRLASHRHCYLSPRLLSACGGRNHHHSSIIIEMPNWQNHSLIDVLFDLLINPSKSIYPSGFCLSLSPLLENMFCLSLSLLFHPYRLYLLLSCIQSITHLK